LRQRCGAANLQRADGRIQRKDDIAMNKHLHPLLRLLTTVSCAAMACLHPSATLAHEASKHSVASTDAGHYARSLRSYAIPEVVLTDADARPVPLRELLAANDPVMLNFIFTSCTTICPVLTKVFSEVPPLLGAEAKRLRMVSISIDPENDTPAKLKAYARKFEAGERWSFLTGRVQDVIAVQRAFDTYGGDKMSHEPLTLLRSAPGKPWVRIDGFARSDDLASEYRKLVRK
jgi:protein SCO1